MSYFKTVFLHAMAVLGYLSKLERGLGLAFGAFFLPDFSIKIIPYLILYQWTKFQCDTLFLSQDFRENMWLISYLDSWRRHKLWDFSWINLWSNGWHGKIEGRTKIQKFKYLENEKSFSDEIKSIFHSFWRGLSFGEKHKFDKK